MVGHGTQVEFMVRPLCTTCRCDTSKAVCLGMVLHEQASWPSALLGGTVPISRDLECHIYSLQYTECLLLHPFQTMFHNLPHPWTK
jgi:hypothetical protein